MRTNPNDNKKRKKGDLTIYHVDKLITDDKMETLKNTYVKPSQIKLTIIMSIHKMENLLRFRKDKLTTNKSIES